MTIQTVEGNVLNVDTGVIIHGCNAQGVMGGGIALEIKNRFPEVFRAYRETYEKQGKKLYMGQIIPVQVAVDKWIVNAVTQEYFGGDKSTRYVSYDAIATAFDLTARYMDTVSTYVDHEAKRKLFFPKIGAGLANGNWDVIETIIDTTVSDDIKKTLYIFQP